MYDNVFISYAKEDIITAQSLYDFLRNSTPFKPWYDKVNLLPGHNWREEINFALKKADFIILILSKISISKVGYIQKEFKLALDYCEERPDNAIYIIPVVIDDCDVPEKFSKYQWVKLGDWDSHSLILQALNAQREKSLKQELLKIAQNLSYEFHNHELDEVVGDTICHKINITYPQFSNYNNLCLLHLNTYIKTDVFKIYNAFLHYHKPNISNGNEHHPGSEKKVNINLELLTPHFISLTMFQYSYTGGAHGNYGTVGLNYLLNPLYEITLIELLDFRQDALLLLARVCKQKLLDKAKSKFGVEDEKQFFLYNYEEQISWEFFDNFYIGKNTINLLFGPYKITAYSYGSHEIEISFNELLDIIPTLERLRGITELIKLN